MSESGPGFYPDVNACEALLRYDLVPVGCCKVINHPQWGTRNYPATLFTTAPVEVLNRVLDEINSV